jgi:2,4-dienoyl-CoA reductase-like NADH-dependent reductase (Old Yellow Enzyme family)
MTRERKKSRRGSYRIFSEGEIAGQKTKNRLVRSATYEAAANRDGTITDTYINFHRTLARGGVGTIITGLMPVSEDGRGAHRQAGIWADFHIFGLRKVADAVHGEAPDITIFAQLAHAGRNIPSNFNLSEPVGPSEVPSPILKRQVRVLSVEEIERIIGRFSDAIVRVRKAGFDGVQLHGAHGYLISSFLSPYTNRRTDRFGGSLEKRARIVSEIVSSARKRVGSDFPILIKMNADDFVPDGITIDTFPALAKKIEASGIDAIEVSGGTWDCLARSEEELGFFPIPFADSRIRIDDPEKQSYFLPYAKSLDLKIPVILVGGHRSIERMEDILENSPVDFLSLARPLISEPDLPNRWLSGNGHEAPRCVSCNGCYLTINKGPVRCLWSKKITHAMARKVVPHTWKLIFN